MQKTYVEINGKEFHKTAMLTAFHSYFAIRLNEWEMFIDDLCHVQLGDDKESFLISLKEKKNGLMMFQKAYAIARPDVSKETVKKSLDYISKEEILHKIEEWDITKPLILSYSDALLLNAILEEYIRIHMGQFFDLSDDLAAFGYTYNKNDLENSNKFNMYINRRNACHDLLDKAIYIIQPYRGLVSIYKTDIAITMENIWQIIRKEFYLYKKRTGLIDDKDMFFRDAYVLLLNEEEPISCQIKEEPSITHD